MYWGRVKEVGKVKDGKTANCCNVVGVAALHSTSLQRIQVTSDTTKPAEGQMLSQINTLDCQQKELKHEEEQK